MIPVKQKLMHGEGVKGDCLRACICSLLEISDEGVPNFVDDNNYPEKLWEWCQENKLLFYNSDCPPENIEYYMAWGTSPRGLKHSVIYKDGKLVHDPHPDGGDVKDITTYAWLERVPINPDYIKLAKIAYDTVLQTMLEGEKEHGADRWQNVGVMEHFRHALDHLANWELEENDEDHIAHALTRCAMIKYLEAEHE